MIANALILFVSTIFQSASFTLVSRARNSPSILFHLISSLASNTIWLLVLRQVVTQLDSVVLMVTYVFGSAVGSVVMHYVSMEYLEKLKIFNTRR